MTEVRQIFDPDQLYSQKQIAQRMGVTRQMIAKLMLEEKLPYVLIGPRCRRILGKDINTFIANQTELAKAS